MSTLIFDIETNGCVNSKGRFTLEELHTIHCIALKNLETGKLFSFGPDSIEMALEILENEGDILVAHNGIGFDYPAIWKLYPDWSPKGQLRDSKLMAALRWPHMESVDLGMGSGCKVDKRLRGTHGLKAWGQRLGIHKGDYGESMEDPWSQWSQEMQDYCEQDVEVLATLYEKLLEKAEWSEADQLEHDLNFYTTYQERHGVLLDVQKAQELVATLRGLKEPLEQRIQEAFPPTPRVCLGPYGNQAKRAEKLLSKRQREQDMPNYWENPKVRAGLEKVGIKFKWEGGEPFNPNSPCQVGERLVALGWKPTTFTPTGQPAVPEETLEAIAKTIPEAQPLAERVVINKRLQQLVDGKGSWLNMVDQQGRIHGGVNTMGTVTFRFTHFKPDMNVPKVKEPWGKQCRELFTVPEGYKMVGCDASGLELRVMAHYLAAYDNGLFAKEVLEGDVHTRNQKAAGLPTRDDAKTFIYAFLYGAGNGRLGEIVGGDKKDGADLRARFLSKTPALKRLMRDVQNKVKVRKKLWTLDRWVYPRSLHSALNMLFQATGSIVVKRATVNFMQDCGLPMGEVWHPVIHKHDELQLEVQEAYVDIVARAAEAAFEDAGIFYDLKCPMAGEAKVGNDWSETH